MADGPEPRAVRGTAARQVSADGTVEKRSCFSLLFQDIVKDSDVFDVFGR